ncbi:hypothetical protein KC865_05080 [Candidatus Kaiserbacteria bacterium]|nr:hypothetical protein [Candidatus Kaiserbacteria bacterium]USN92211.1 MAG: hypothetical protein H6782_00045 [Candidatus Nomurabacteria bacterium]
MQKLKSEKGQSLIEIIFAVAVFTIGVVTIGYLVLDARALLLHASDVDQARWLASEGIEAVVSMQPAGFDLLKPGTYGLALEQGVWTLSPSVNEFGKFTRGVVIDNVDVDIKNITSFVKWNTISGNEKTISYTTHVSNWMQKGGQAGDLDVNIDNALVVASGTALSGLLLNNEGDGEITITEMTLEWDSLSSLQKITIMGQDVFVAPTSSGVHSGEVIDIDDYQLNPVSELHPIDIVRFDGDVSDTDFTARFKLEDGTMKSVYIVE